MTPKAALNGHSILRSRHVISGESQVPWEKATYTFMRADRSIRSQYCNRKPILLYMAKVKE